MTTFRRSEWFVAPADHEESRKLVEAHHYARGASNTFVYLHGLFRKGEPELKGVAWWLPPTRVACESVNRKEWKRVLSLSRLVILPDAPKNAASFLLSRSVRLIRDEGRFVSLVTYADTEQGHTGAIYKAANWRYDGLTSAYPVWVDEAGRRVAPKATRNRTKAEMLTRGFRQLGHFRKHKYILHLRPVRRRVSYLTYDEGVFA